MQNVDNIEQRLRNAGITPTRQRMAIASVMLAKAQHLSAEQLQIKIAETGIKGVSKATVYNTLGLFLSKGLVREVIADPNRVFYDSNTSAHHHLFDIDTGVLVDIAAEDIDVRHLPALAADMEVAGVDVTVRVRRRS